MCAGMRVSSACGVVELHPCRRRRSDPPQAVGEDERNDRAVLALSTMPHPKWVLSKALQSAPPPGTALTRKERSIVQGKVHDVQSVGP